MEKIDGISILVGTGECNANCKFCAGKQHRHLAHKKDGEIIEDKLIEILNLCKDNNCKSVSLTGSGEPTKSPISVINILKLIDQYYKGLFKIKLYTNGILLSDYPFANWFLNNIKELGVTDIYLTLHELKI